MGIILQTLHKSDDFAAGHTRMLDEAFSFRRV